LKYAQKYSFEGDRQGVLTNLYTRIYEYGIPDKEQGIMKDELKVS
jgi:hypothetical protein